MISTKSLHVDGHVLEFRREMISASTMGGIEPDPEWRFTDAAGHVHCRVGRDIPTLVKVVDEEPYFCRDCEDYHDGESHQECAQCGEVIKPGTRSRPGGQMFMPRMEEYLLDGQPISREDAEAWIATAQAAKMWKVR